MFAHFFDSMYSSCEVAVCADYDRGVIYVLECKGEHIRSELHIYTLFYADCYALPIAFFESAKAYLKIGDTVQRGKETLLVLRPLWVIFW